MLRYFTYHIPFKNTFSIAGRNYSHRNGVILVYQENEIEAYGEIAPLPGFSSESLDQVIEVLKLNKSYIENELKGEERSNLLQVITQIHQIPSLSFGIDTLLHDLAAKRKGIPLYKYLFPQTKVTTISANGTLSIQTPEKTLEQATNLIEEGYTTLKVKVGVDFELEQETLKKLRSKFPDINIRIDANEAWSIEKAIQYLKKLEPLNIEYCEQPVSADNADNLRKVKDAVRIPIAADEFIRNKSSLEELSKVKAADLAIIKPMLMGTFKNIFVTNTEANTHDIEVVYTTLLESAVGRATTIALAAGSGNDKRAHGLSSGKNLTTDVCPEKWLNKPEITLPNVPGLGISLNKDSLNEL